MTPDINKILASENVSSKRGAPMGATPYLNDPTQPLYVQPVKMVDGAYGGDGTYWGSPPSRKERLWCAFSPSGANRIYVRAADRGEALRKVEKDYKEARFIGRGKRS